MTPARQILFHPLTSPPSCPSHFVRSNIAASDRVGEEKSREPGNRREPKNHALFPYQASRLNQSKLGQGRICNAKSSSEF